jgi:hypothetical protein
MIGRHKPTTVEHQSQANGLRHLKDRLFWSVQSQTNGRMIDLKWMTNKLNGQKHSMTGRHKPTTVEHRTDQLFWIVQNRGIDANRTMSNLNGRRHRVIGRPNPPTVDR